MPRLISSLCVSVHFPVSACVSDVFPWSTWPTRPIFTSGLLSKRITYATKSQVVLALKVYMYIETGAKSILKRCRRSLCRCFLFLSLRFFVLFPFLYFRRKDLGEWPGALLDDSAVDLYRFCGYGVAAHGLALAHPFALEPLFLDLLDGAKAQSLREQRAFLHHALDVPPHRKAVLVAAASDLQLVAFEPEEVTGERLADLLAKQRRFLLVFLYLHGPGFVANHEAEYCHSNGYSSRKFISAKEAIAKRGEIMTSEVQDVNMHGLHLSPSPPLPSPCLPVLFFVPAPEQPIYTPAGHDSYGETQHERHNTSYLADPPPGHCDRGRRILL